MAHSSTSLCSVSTGAPARPKATPASSSLSASNSTSTSASTSSTPTFQRHQHHHPHHQHVHTQIHSRNRRSETNLRRSLLGRAPLILPTNSTLSVTSFSIHSSSSPTPSTPNKNPKSRHLMYSFLYSSSSFLVLLSTLSCRAGAQAPPPAPPRGDTPTAQAAPEPMAAAPAAPAPHVAPTSSRPHPATPPPKPSETVDPLPPPPPPPPPPQITATNPAVTDYTTTTSTSRVPGKIITVADSIKPIDSSKSNSGPIATETPARNTADDDKNGSIMLTASLIVVFVVLAAMGIVVFCLFRRRSAKRRMHLFGKSPSSNGSSTGGLDDILAAAEQRRNSVQSLSGGATGATKGGPGSRRASELDVSRALQEMSEVHQQALMSRRSSTLSLGGLHGPGQGPYPSRMLSPTLSTARPHSMGSGYWGGGVGGPGTNSSTNSILIGSGEYISGPLASSPDFRNSQFDDYYGAASSEYGQPQHVQFLYPGAGGGFANYNSNEHLLPAKSRPSSVNMSRRSSLSPGIYPPKEMPQQLNPVFRSKTVGGSGHGPHLQQQQHQHHPYPHHQIPYSGSPAYYHQNNGSDIMSPLLMQVVPSGAVLPSAENLSESGNSSASASTPRGLGRGDPSTTPLMRPQSMSGLQNTSSLSIESHSSGESPSRPVSSPVALDIPPSITTRRRSMVMMSTGSVHTRPAPVTFQHRGPPHPPYPQAFQGPSAPIRSSYIQSVSGQGSRAPDMGLVTTVVKSGPTSSGPTVIIAPAPSSATVPAPPASGDVPL